MDDDRILRNLLQKVMLVKRVSYALCGQPRINVADIKLEVYESPKSDDYIEFLVVTYEGGAIAARNCTANSPSANVREIANLLDGGYYDEVESYKKVKSTWKKIL